MSDRLRHIFDEQERRLVQYPDAIREETARVVRHISPHDQSGLISFAPLTTTDADAAIAEQIAYYTSIGHTFNWRYMDYDTPADMPERLTAHGLVTDEPDAVCVLEIATAPPDLLIPPDVEILRLTDPTDLDVVETIWVGVDRGELGIFREVLAKDMAAGLTTIHIALVEGIAASMGGTFYAANDFANMWGGATLPDYRHRGLYRALLASRLVEARARDKKFLRVDCGPMSRPIVERAGFTCIGMVWTYRYGSEPTERLNEE